MTIYFEDGWLLNARPLARFIPYHDHVIDAGAGLTANEYKLNEILEFEPDSIVYTNSLVALHNRYCWNKSLKVPDLYIRSGPDKPFKRVDSLTNRELREGHNLLKMYWAGEFRGRRHNP